ncbi:MAG: Dabb family protein [Chthoniobacterales bacterium]
MIHHLVLFKTSASVDDDRIEWMMRETRIQLLKIPEVLSVKCGKQIDPKSEWSFFLSVDVESMDKLAIYRDDPIHVKFVDEVIRPFTTERLALDFETDPARDVTYS